MTPIPFCTMFSGYLMSSNLSSASMTASKFPRWPIQIFEDGDGQRNEGGSEQRPPLQGCQPSLWRRHGSFLFKGVRGSARPHSFRRCAEYVGSELKNSLQMGRLVETPINRDGVVASTRHLSVDQIDHDQRCPPALASGGPTGSAALRSPVQNICATRRQERRTRFWIDRARGVRVV